MILAGCASGAMNTPEPLEEGQAFRYAESKADLRTMEEQEEK